MSHELRTMSYKSWIKYFIKFLLSFLIFTKKSRFWLKIAFSSPKYRHPAVFYGYPHIPDLGEPIKGRGGIIKFQRLNQYLPNTLFSFNILYLGSSVLPAEWRQIVRLASRKKAKLVVNQNGIMYPRHGDGWETMNHPLKRLLHNADYVFYQSKFCKMSANRFLGERSGPGEILYNCVDTDVFIPPYQPNRSGELVLLLGGNQYEFYRLEVAFRTIAYLLKHSRQKIRLLVTGQLNWINNRNKARAKARELALSLGVAGHVDFVGTYSQSKATDIFHRAHILLHTKYKDPSPGVVVEAMSCGLPVVCSHSGGVPELVGMEAGICVPVEDTWDREIWPDPELLARAVLKVYENLKHYSEAARQRAVDRLDLKPWVQRHMEVFETLLD